MLQQATTQDDRGDEEKKGPVALELEHQIFRKIQSRRRWRFSNSGQSRAFQKQSIFSLSCAASRGFKPDEDAIGRRAVRGKGLARRMDGAGHFGMGDDDAFIPDRESAGIVKAGNFHRDPLLLRQIERVGAA